MARLVGRHAFVVRGLLYVVVEAIAAKPKMENKKVKAGWPRAAFILASRTIRKVVVHVPVKSLETAASISASSTIRRVFVQAQGPNSRAQALIVEIPGGDLAGRAVAQGVEDDGPPAPRRDCCREAGTPSASRSQKASTKGLSTPLSLTAVRTPRSLQR